MRLGCIYCSIDSSQSSIVCLTDWSRIASIKPEPRNGGTLRWLIVQPYTGRNRVWECGRSFWRGVWPAWLRECPGWRDVCHPPPRYASFRKYILESADHNNTVLHNVTIRARAWTIGAALWLVTGSVDHNAASDGGKVNRGNASLRLRLSSNIGSGIVVN